MAPVNPHDGLPQSPESHSSRVDHLEEELAKLKTDVEKGNRGIAGWCKRWGALLALVVAIFAVPRGFLDAVHTFWSRPKTSLTALNSVEVGYNPNDKHLSFNLNIGVYNSGNTVDFVKGWAATITEISAPSSPTYSFGIADIKCDAPPTHAQIPMPLPLPVFTPTSLSCTLAKADINPFHGTGTYKIDFALSGQNDGSKPLSYCFDMSETLITEIMSSGFPQSRTVITNPTCGAH